MLTNFAYIPELRRYEPQHTEDAHPPFSESLSVILHENRPLNQYAVELINLTTGETKVLDLWTDAKGNIDFDVRRAIRVYYSLPWEVLNIWDLDTESPF